MNPQKWRLIEDVFQEALDLPENERAAFISEKCGADEELRREVEKLIARYEKEETFLESPVWTDSRFLQTQAKREIMQSLDDEISERLTPKSLIGERLGVYRLTEELGRGGMGVVYLAERADGEFHQKVAVKLVKNGIDTDFVVRRFRHERQILANLNHSNIARLVDGGTTKDGSPYFIMEYIEGKPFLQYCADEELNLREKLELFQQICRAVIYAHRKKIVHRDIKPSNILVTIDGVPKLLDFGIAKLLDPDAIPDSAMPQTGTAMRLMTPEYASPEQIKSDAITEATDQYSLGVLLYELLTGSRPYKFPSRAPHEIARVICEEIPSEPSSGNFGKAFAADTDFRFDADFCRNLDRIVLKTLRKNPSERYASVEEFTADIERFLRGEAVHAEAFDRETNETPESRAAVETKGKNKSINSGLSEAPTSIQHQNTSPDANSISANNKSAIAWRGVKQGIFLLSLGVVSLPVSLGILIATGLPGIIQFVLFVVLFGGGLLRVLYAFLFESPENDHAEHDPKKYFRRKRNIQLGLFLIILTLLLFPIFLGLVVGGVFDPVPLIGVMTCVFGGGLLLSIYAAFFQKTAVKAEDIGKITSSIPESEKNLKVSSLVKYGLAVIIFTAVAVVFYNIFTHTKFSFDASTPPASESWKSSFASRMKPQRLTTDGKAQTTAISPDGKTVAFVSSENGRQSLKLRSIETETERELIAPDAVYYTDVKFSPDNQFVYYLVSRLPARTLYRVAAQGGVPEKISENVLNLFAISPDNKKIVYDNRNSDSRQHSLFIADFDPVSGALKSARTLFVLDSPNYFPGGFEFSPDGSKIVYPRSVIIKQKEVNDLFVYDLIDGTNESLGARSFNRIYQAAWRNDSEIVISATENESAPHQLWLIDYPNGETTRLTNDFSNYVGVILTADRNALATTKMNISSNVWTTETAATNANFDAKNKQITAGFDRQDGLNGVNWTADKRILYVSVSGEKRGISLIDADGTNNQTLAIPANDPKYPAMTSDNRFLVYADKKDGQLNIWRFEMANGALASIVSDFAVTPALSPDNQFVFYSALLNPDNRLMIHRRALNADSEPNQITGALSVRPVVSPDGKSIACNFSSAETNNSWQIGILSASAKNNSADAVKILKPYTNNFFRSPQERPLAWSPDNRFLYFLNNVDNAINIFRISIENDAPPVQMTFFKSDEIYDFALSSDGKQFVISRGTTLSDVVIFNNTSNAVVR